MSNVLTTTLAVGSTLTLVSESMGNPLCVAVEAGTTPGGGSLVMTATNGSGTAAPDETNPFTFTLATALQVDTRSQVFITGIANLQPTVDADQEVMIDGSLVVELSLDGGATFVPQSPDPILWFCRNGTGGIGSGAISIPINAQSSGTPITDDVQVRVTLLNAGVSNNDVTALIALQAIFAEEA